MPRTIELWSNAATSDELRKAIKAHKEALARTTYQAAKKALRGELSVMRKELARRR